MARSKDVPDDGTISSLEEDLRLSESRYAQLMKENAGLRQKLRKTEARRDALEWSLVLAQHVVRRLQSEQGGSAPEASDWVMVAF